MNINIGRINEGMTKGIWGDYENDHIIVSIMKHHAIVTMKKGQWKETLLFNVRDTISTDYECKNNVLTKKIDDETTILLCLKNQ